MIKKFFLNYSNRFVSRWLILAVDLFIVAITFMVSYLLRFNFNYDSINWADFQIHLPFVLFIYAVGFFYFNSYSGVIRHTSMIDAIRIFDATTVSAVFVLGLTSILIFLHKENSIFYVPYSIAIIHYLLATVILLSSRVIVKLSYFKIVGTRHHRTNVLIYGAGQSGIITKNTLVSDTSKKYDVVGFLDDNPSMKGKIIEGVKVYQAKHLEEIVKEKKIKTLVISIQNISSARKRAFVERCLHLDLEVKSVPSVDRWINGELSSRQIKNVRIEDLLQREPIKLDHKNVNRELSGKTVLVTGAAGSIGSEISRQVLHYAPKKLIMIDQAESALYEIEFEIKSKYKTLNNYRFVVADVQDARRMDALFEEHKPDVVFHAAAYKHVPLMEQNPTEAVGVNVFGTKTLADTALRHKVTKFVMVSTDKAVNPTNVMGATKRIAEIYTQSLNNAEGAQTKFIVTRFGNVLGSNGSVIPLFRKQIESGGPIKVTHPEITRFFMTIPEACQLVLEAGAMGNGGEVFVFDMGKSVKIIDVAKQMIKLSGLVLGQDITIEIIGLRPGEKLYEELLNVKENTVKTHHPKIMIGKVEKYNFDQVVNHMTAIRGRLDAMDTIGMVKEMKRLVPEYISQNSQYEALDKELESESTKS